MKAMWLGLVLSVALAAPGVAKADAEAFSKSCAKCHGKEGKGDTKVGKKLKVKDLSTAEWQKGATDDAIFKDIKEGKGDVQEDGEKAMPKFSDKFSDDQIKSLVKVIRGFGPK